MLIRTAFIDERGEPNIITTTYYFDSTSYKIYKATMKASKKVSSLRKNNVIAYSIDDPTPGHINGLENRNQQQLQEEIQNESYA